MHRWHARLLALVFFAQMLRSGTIYDWRDFHEHMHWFSQGMTFKEAYDKTGDARSHHTAIYPLPAPSLCRVRKSRVTGGDHRRVRAATRKWW